MFTAGSLCLQAREKLRIENDVELHLLALWKLTTSFSDFGLSS